MNKLIKLELKLLQIEHRQSFEVLNSLLAEDFLEIVPSGTEWTKQQIIQSLTSSKDNEAYEASDMKVKKISKTVVILNYITKKPSHSELQRRTSIWQKRQGRWQMIFHQGTIVK